MRKQRLQTNENDYVSAKSWRAHTYRTQAHKIKQDLRKFARTY